MHGMLSLGEWYAFAVGALYAYLLGRLKKDPHCLSTLLNKEVGWN